MYNHSIRNRYACSSGQILLLACLSLLGASGVIAQKQLYILNRGTNNVVSVLLAQSQVQPAETLRLESTAPYDLTHTASGAALYWSNDQSRGISPTGILTTERPPTSAKTAILDLPVDLDMDDQHQKLYWVDHVSKAIRRSGLNGSDVETVATDTLLNPSSLALFAAMNLLFYADLDRNRIWSSSLDGQHRKVLVETDAEFPVRLLVDPLHGKLYWANDGEHLIERINLDGSDREIFYQGLEAEHPFGLLLDNESGMLYWTDYGSDQVMRKSLNVEAAAELIASGLADPVALVILNRPEDRSAGSAPDSGADITRLSLFPNPANKEVMFQSLHAGQVIDWIRIYDRIGNEIFFGKAGANSYQLDIHFYADGYYSYTAQVAGQLLSGHFSIIH